MRRLGLIGLAAAGLFAAGCHHTCGDRPRLFPRLTGHASDRAPEKPHCDDRCIEATPTSGTGAGYAFGTPSWSGAGSGFATPVYPGGYVPSGPGSPIPSNELPYPRIPPTGLPETGSATPIPAIPSSGTHLVNPARTTGK